MKIGIDARTLSVRGGPRTYVDNLIRTLPILDEKNEYIVFYNKKEFLTKYENVKGVIVKPDNIYFQLIWDQVLLPISLKKEKVDLVHNTKSSTSIINPCYSVVTIHDIIPIVYKQTEKFTNYLYWNLQIPLAAKHANQIITVSESAKKDIVNYYKIREDKISVIYNGVSEKFRIIESKKELDQIKSLYSLPDKYILYVGTLQPRKNLPLLIKSYGKLVADKKITHKLLIVGREGWKYSAIFSLIKELHLEKDIIITGYIQDDDLPYIFNLANLFVYPSIYEGFGLPPLEAMACGIPVITSNTSSLPEVVGNAGIMINPYDVDCLAKVMFEALTNEGLRRDMIKKGLERSKLFSWEKTARETLKVYEETMK